MSIGRKVRRSRVRRHHAGWLTVARQVACTIAPLAERHDLVVAIKPPRGDEVAEVLAFDSAGELRCPGCAALLDDAIAGTTHLGQLDSPLGIIVRVCDDCMEPETRSAIA